MSETELVRELRNADEDIDTLKREIERLKAERAAVLCDVTRAIKQAAASENPFDAESEWFAHQVWGKVRGMGAAQAEIERLRDSILIAIAGTVCTPERGYNSEPAELVSDVKKLAGEWHAQQQEIERLRELVKAAYLEGAIDGRHAGRDMSYDRLWRESRFPAALSTPPAPQSSSKLYLEHNLDDTREFDVNLALRLNAIVDECCRGVDHSIGIELARVAHEHYQAKEPQSSETAGRDFEAMQQRCQKHHADVQAAMQSIVDT